MRSFEEAAKLGRPGIQGKILVFNQPWLNYRSPLPQAPAAVVWSGGGFAASPWPIAVPPPKPSSMGLG